MRSSAIWGALADAANRALAVVAPWQCAACDVPLGTDALFCAICEPEPPEAPYLDVLPNGVQVVATGLYEGALATAVQRLKYGARPDLARPLGQRLAYAIESALGPRAVDLLVPVPLHPRRLADRHYNQAALVARAAASELGIGAMPRALARVRKTEEQAKLGKDDRRTNVEDAFVARAPLLDRRVVVVDDVVTTGATAVACGVALARAGAVVVAIAAVARAD